MQLVFRYNNNGMALSPVRLTGPIRQPRLVLADNLHAVVGAAAVNNDVFQVRVALYQDRTDGLFDELSLIVGRRDDAHPWPGAPIWHLVRKLWAFLRPRPAGFARRRRRKFTQGRTAHGESRIANWNPEETH